VPLLQSLVNITLTLKQSLVLKHLDR
jgi:hypothetical protein